jgi:hypothetical protein
VHNAEKGTNLLHSTYDFVTLREERTVTLELRDELAAGLTALAAAEGVSLEVYLQRLVDRELPASEASSERSGMIYENGLLVYRTGRPLSTEVVDNVIRRNREDRARHILGHSS